MKASASGPVSIFLVMAGIILGLPLLGSILWTDRALSYYLEFPPRLGGVEQAPFSWKVFIGLGALILIILLPFILRAARTAARYRKSQKPPSRSFPWWGYAGAIICACAWVLAWNRFSWFSRYQPYTFPLLWIGYIIIVNALTCKRSGTCLALGMPFYFLALFPTSAVFWWFFEYLNRFVLNWYYAQVNMFGPWQYVFYASACFATVLPGVLSTAELLRSFPFFKSAYQEFIPIRTAHPNAAATMLLTIAAAGLLFLGLLPDILFPILWVSPLLAIVSLQALAGQEHIFTRVARGDWTRPVSLVFAALICGFFWEMWNYHSLARWEYSIPYVDRFPIFEMPVLGYAGYFPFGLECGAAGDLLKSFMKGPGGKEQRLGV